MSKFYWAQLLQIAILGAIKYQRSWIGTSIGVMNIFEGGSSSQMAL